MLPNVPLTVDEITEHNEAIYTELRLDERPIGCIVKWDAPTKAFTFEKAQAQFLTWFIRRDNQQFVIGDFYNACERIFKEAVANIPPNDELIQLTGHTQERLYTWSSICNQYAHEQRLYPLRFSFYQEVAYVKPHTLRAELLEWALVPNPDGSSKTTKQLREKRNEVERERLLKGNWDVANSGLVYDNWDSTLNISEHADYLPGYPVYWFVDDGYTNPRAILLCQQRPFMGKPDRLCVFAEYEQSGTLAAQSIADVKSWPYPEPDVVYYDAAAPEFAANAQAVGLFTAGGPKDISRNMQIVRRLICDHNGERMIMVHPRCKKTIEAIPAFRYSETKKLPNGEPAPEHDDSSHINAALWYGCATIYYYIEVA